MKKFLVITFILLCTFGFAVWETVSVNSVYGDIEKYAAQVVEILDETDGNISESDKLSDTARKLEKKWLDFAAFANNFSNHTAVKNFTEKVVMLTAYIKTDSKTDAYATARAIKALSGEMKNEALPLIGNLL